ncbi:hypothetical protein [Gluconacetobacter tumulisoli]|uniref:Chorismate lyase n=1 Tax=Gluconacetobacter tumulisoli TaxID=1286189 RepID=A0A7W4K6T0_9PROT|nr:hypothetical protein [Gluconacetobacter tumulisoli]MBB2201300.1 hypothetical protein [Gluconacetobacter tumulisoli]
MILRRGLALLLLTAMLASAGGAGAADWPDTGASRKELQTLIDMLDDRLLRQPSATLTLEEWCRTHDLAPVAHVVAHRVRGVEKTPTPIQRQALDVAAREQVRYRRVDLTCGDRVLSVADNWYVPGRLTPDMNAALDHSDVAFGHAVAALHFTRRTLESTRLWSPLRVRQAGAPAPRSGPGVIRPPAAILRHRAVLYRQDGVPFSEVVETYTGAMLDFPPPSR